MIIANNVAEAIEKYKVDKVFIDGVGVGGGVVDSPVNGNNPRTSTRVTSWFIPFCSTILS
jgi:hypothetical protein